MQIANLRPMWLITMTALLTVALVGCMSPENVRPYKHDSVEGLCWRILSPLAEFQEAVDLAGTGDPESAINQASSAAKRISAAIEITRRQEVELEAYDLEWIDGLDLAAQTYVALSDGGIADLSDEQAMAVLIRIDEWFFYAADRCVGTNA